MIFKFQSIELSMLFWSTLFSYSLSPRKQEFVYRKFLAKLKGLFHRTNQDFSMRTTSIGTSFSNFWRRFLNSNRSNYRRIVIGAAVIGSIFLFLITSKTRVRLSKISRETGRITSTEGISRFSMIGCSEQHRCVEFDGSEFKNRHDSRVSRFMGRLIPTICKWLAASAATMASCSIHDCNIGAGPAGSIFRTKTRRIGQLSRADRNWTLSRIGHEWFHRKKYPPIGCTRTRPDSCPFWILSGWSRGPIEPTFFTT